MTAPQPYSPPPFPSMRLLQTVQQALGLHLPVLPVLPGGRRCGVGNRFCKIPPEEMHTTRVSHINEMPGGQEELIRGIREKFTFAKLHCMSGSVLPSGQDKKNLRNIGKTVFLKLSLQINEDDIFLFKETWHNHLWVSQLKHNSFLIFSKLASHFRATVER